MPTFKVINRLSSFGIKVLTSESPGFTAHLAKLLNPAAIAKAEPFLNRSVILINSGPVPLTGFTLIYRYPTQIALSGKPWEQRIRRFAANSDTASFFQPGDEFLFTPVAGFDARLNEAGTVHSQPWLDDGTDRMIAAYLSSWLDDPTELSVDAVVSLDGAVIGADTADTFGYITAEIKAELEIQAAFTLSGDALRKKLLSLTGMHDGTHYARYLDATARSMLREIDSAGEDVVRQEATQRAGSLPFLRFRESLRRVE